MYRSRMNFFFYPIAFVFAFFFLPYSIMNFFLFLKTGYLSHLLIFMISFHFGYGMTKMAWTSTFVIEFKERGITYQRFWIKRFIRYNQISEIIMVKTMSRN